MPATVPAAGVITAKLSADFDRAGEFAQAEKAAATRRAYKSDFAIFRAWCSKRNVSALPASSETAAAFLASEAMRNIKPSTLGRRTASIRYAHKLAGHAVPTDDERVRATLRGIRRSAGNAPARKAPATVERLIAMAAASEGGLVALRDRALLLLGFGGAFRRSELVGLDVADILESNEGLLVTVRRSKTDQEGRSTTVAVLRGKIACPAEALRAWLTAAGISEGPVFRPISKGKKIRSQRLTDRSVANIIKYRAERLGLDPKAFSGHSLRSGFLTSAAARGASLFKLADVSRHRAWTPCGAISAMPRCSRTTPVRDCFNRNSGAMPYNPFII